MRKTLFLAFFLLNLVTEAKSQSDSGSIGALSAYVVPLPWIDRNPRLRLGMEYHSHNHKSYSLEVGFGNKHFNHSRLDNVVWGQAYSFFEVRPEIKWFVKDNAMLPWYLRSSTPFPRYFAVEMFYQEMHDELDNNNFNPKTNETDISYDQASFKKIKIGTQAKVGIKILIWKKVMLDIYEGVGLAYRKITYFNVINPRPFDEPGTNEQWWPESYKDEGTYFLFQLSFGVRVGYVISRTIDN